MATNRQHKPDNGRIKAPLESATEMLLDPFVDFARAQTTGGFILFFAAVIAISFASSDARPLYESVRHLPMGFNVGNWVHTKSLIHWTNEGLMALFFFLLGLEIKRELLAGQLADVRRAMTVAAAAAGGMLVPAFCYLAINGGSEYSQGWGIPVATDTAFALAVIVFLARHVPSSVRAFLIGLAIVDDLGAIAIIALFYTAEVDGQFLLAASCLLFLGVVLNLTGVRHPFPYAVLGIGVWATVAASGVHGTIAGVLVAALAPVRPVVRQRKFVELVGIKLRQFRESRTPAKDHHIAMLAKGEQQLAAEEIRDAAVMVTSPLKRWERALDYPVTLFVLPVFAFLNAGLHLDAEEFRVISQHPVTWGIALGLIIGKPVGVFLGTFLAVRSGICDLPRDMSLKQVVGIGFLAGIGFTMSVFISGLGFAEGSQELAAAKGAILGSSAVAALLAFMWLRFTARPTEVGT